jgi:uncharacterized membrane protein YqiK
MLELINTHFNTIVGVLLAPFILAAIGWIIGMFRYIPNNRLAVVEKLFSGAGSVENGLIALKGEAGFQPAVLRGGMHFFMPFQYRVHLMPLVTIPQGTIGYVFARDGQALPPSQALASNEKASDFQDTEAFLKAGGQKGPQRKILREGTYALNMAQFVVLTKDQVYGLSLDPQEQRMFQQMLELIHERDGFEPVVIKDQQDSIGVVTVHDGASLSADQIIAPIVGGDPTKADTYHNNFQEPERFLAAGGRRGRQLQVLVEGTYYINRLFATIERVPKTVIEVGHVGVVVSYTGEIGKDLSGADYKHGELIEKGARGVWNEPLLPGKYAFNTYAGRIIAVPTTNFILKWNRLESGAHKLDENLSEVTLITKDAFEPVLPLSVVVHIDYRKAPLVVQRFGDIKKLVEQTLDPMVAAYFKNVGQTRTLIQLIQDRSAIQQQASTEMKEKFQQYNLELLEVLIGTPGSPPAAPGKGTDQIDQILIQLRSRQIAEEQVETYKQQEKAAVKERELREAESRAKQQTNLTESELSIIVQTNQGKADFARSQQQAAQIQTLAAAEAEKVRIMAEGEAKKIHSLAQAEAEKAAKIGIAQAMAIQEQVRAYGGPKFQLTQQVMARFAEAIETARVDVVPKIMINGNGHGEGGSDSSKNLFEGLMALLLSDRMGLSSEITQAAENPAIEKMKKELTAKIGDTKLN